MIINIDRHIKPQNGALWSYEAVYTLDRNMRSASKILYQRVLQKKFCKDKNAFLVLRFTMLYFLFHCRHQLIRFFATFEREMHFRGSTWIYRIPFYLTSSSNIALNTHV